MNFKYIKRRLTALSYEDRGNVRFESKFFLVNLKVVEKFPNYLNIFLWDPESLKKLVLWLERTTIRKIDPHKREPLTYYRSSDYLANLCEVNFRIFFLHFFFFFRVQSSKISFSIYRSLMLNLILTLITGKKILGWRWLTIFLPKQ